jgi:hypothetical protein
LSNYLQEIEDNFSLGRGRASMLSPLDWQLAEQWETKGVPLHIVLNAMNEAFKNFKAQNRKDTINSLRYFEQNVNKTFAEWSSLQVGKSTGNEEISTTEENIMTKTAEVFITGDENIEILNNIVGKLRTFEEMPLPLRNKIAETKGLILELVLDVSSKQLSTDDIEDRLKKLRSDLEDTIAETTDEEDAKQILRSIKDEYKISHTPEVLEKLLIRKLTQNLNLPEITLFAL